MFNKLRYLSFFVFFCIYPLKITRVIISWDNNSMFDFFWPIASKAWSDIGIRPTLIFIGPKGTKIDTTYGDVLYVTPISGIPTPFQATAIRPLAAALFPEDVCILSDLDMIPISKKYFQKTVENVSEDNIAVFYPKYYGENVKRYMMCYNVAKGSTFSEIFKVKNINDIQKTLYSWYVSFYHMYGFTTDEHMLYKYINNWKFKETRLNLLNAKFARLNREKWYYNKNQIKNNTFADAHLPRPYWKFKSEINELLKNLNN